MESEPPISAVNWWRVAVALLLFAHFFLISLHRLNGRVNSEDNNQSPYLAMGLAMHEQRPVSDQLRNPLYPFLLSLFADRTADYYTRAKLFTLVLGFFSLLFLFLTTSRRWGTPAALVLLFVMLQPFIEMSSEVMAETLVTVAFFFAWIFASDGFRNPRWWIAAGVLSALAVQTKATGFALPAAFAGTILIVDRFNFSRGARAGWRFFAAFALALVPLLVYGASEFGAAFFNVDSVSYLWLDDWSDRVRTGAALPTLRSFLESHSLSDIARREASGLVRMSCAIILAPFLFLFGGLPLLQPRWREMSRARDPEVLFAVLLVLIFYVAFAWYVPIAHGPRFIYPILPMVAILSIELVRRTVPIASGGFERLVLVVVTLVFSAVLLAELFVLDLRNPYTIPMTTNVALEQWLSSERARHARIFLGPTKVIPLWRVPRSQQIFAVPDLDLDALGRYATKNSIDYLVLDRDLLAQRVSLFTTVAELDPQRGVRLKQLPAGWHVVASDAARPSAFSVLQLPDPR